MKRLLGLIALILALSGQGMAQTASQIRGAQSLPVNCTPVPVANPGANTAADVLYLVNGGLYVCDSPNHWSLVPVAGAPVSSLTPSTPALANTTVVVETAAGSDILNSDTDGVRVMAIDPLTGFAQFVYEYEPDDITSYIRYARCNDAACSSPTYRNVATEPDDSFDLENPVIAVDSLGFAHIAYINYKDNTIHYIHCGNASCSSSTDEDVTITAVDPDLWAISIAVDAERGVIAYEDANNGFINYIRCTNASCSTKSTKQIVAVDGGEQIAVRVGEDHLARLFYNDYDAGYTTFALCNNAACTSPAITQVDAGNYYYLDFVLDSNGLAYLLFTEDNTTQRFMRCMDTACTSRSTPVNFTTTIYSSGVGLILGDDELPRLLFTQSKYQGSSALYYVKCTTVDCSSNDGVVTLLSYVSSGPYLNGATMVKGLDGLGRIGYGTYTTDSSTVSMMTLVDDSGLGQGVDIGTSTDQFRIVYAINGDFTNVTTSVLNATTFNLDGVPVSFTSGHFTEGLTSTAPTNNPNDIPSIVRIGQNALANATSSNANYATIAIGKDAVSSNVSGTGNIAIGISALKLSTTAGGNVAIGAGNMSNWLTGNSNIAIGTDVMSAGIGGGAENIAIGERGLKALTTGTRNIAMGFNTLAIATDASDNIAIGDSALAHQVTGGGNIAIGTSALNSVATSGNIFDIAIGFGAGTHITTGANNTIVGVNAGGNITTGNGNLVFGGMSQGVTTGSSNIAIGALNYVTSGSNNIGIGANTGDVITTGSSNILIGSNTAVATTSFQFNIGDTIKGILQGGSGPQVTIVPLATGGASQPVCADTNGKLVLGTISMGLVTCP